MYLKGIFKNNSALFQLILLLVLVLIGSLATTLAGGAIIHFLTIPGSSLQENPDMMRWIQLLSATGTFLFPAFGVAWLCDTRVKEYLSIGPVPTLKIAVLTLACLIFLSPVINLTGYLNSQIKLPAFLSSVEEWMRSQEESARFLTDILLADNAPITLLFNLIVIALAAGITEEFFFRGALQNVIGKFTANPHTVIWVTAIIFSVFHLQFYGFIPRILLGAYLGYLLYWGKNIWLPVFAHFINNAIVVFGMSSDHFKETQFFSGELQEEMSLAYFTLTLVSLFILIPLIRKLRETLRNP